jgi:AcrR family transcriptional regulator
MRAETAPTSWTANQTASRRRIVESAADLIAREGLGSCTIRAVAIESGLTKSTVHYYFDDANELVDLAVNTLLHRLADQARAEIAGTRTATQAISYLVRLFMGRGGSPPFKDGMLWSEFVVHAWTRRAVHPIVSGLESMREVFELALRRGVAHPPRSVGERSRSIHHYLLGAMVRNMVEPIPKAELARAVSALSGLTLDPKRC